MELSSKSLFSGPPKPRKEVEDLSPYAAPLEGRRDMLRLDFNENTIGPSPEVLKAIRNIPSKQISIYPEYNGLQEAIASNLNQFNSVNPVQTNQIGLFNGVDAAIHAIFHAYGNKNDKLLTTIPTFGYYHPCALMQGMQVLGIPYEGQQFKFPFKTIFQSLKEENPKLLFICNPNNPTGTIIPANKILGLAKEFPKTLIVVDELYEAFLGESVLPITNFDQTPNLVILRSFSKTAGLAGLRIGFAIGHYEVIDRLQRVTGPYDINSFAVTAALACLSDQKYIDDYVKEVLKAREWIKEKLMTHNIRHFIESGNYFLIWPKKDPAQIESYLRSQGILVRNMNGKTLLEGSLRVSIGTMKQMQYFWDSIIKSDDI